MLHPIELDRLFNGSLTVPPTIPLTSESFIFAFKREVPLSVNWRKTGSGEYVISRHSRARCCSSRWKRGSNHQQVGLAKARGAVSDDDPRVAAGEPGSGARFRSRSAISRAASYFHRPVLARCAYSVANAGSVCTSWRKPGARQPPDDIKAQSRGPWRKRGTGENGLRAKMRKRKAPVSHTRAQTNQAATAQK